MQILLVLALIILVCALTPNGPCQGRGISTPSHILVIRHANKAVNKASAKGGALDSQPLDSEGKRRAEAYIESLARYAQQNYGTNFVNVYAIAPSPDYSMRPEQTIMPFCFTHSIPLHLPATIFDPNLNQRFIESINSNIQNKNKPVLVCFEHTCIQSLIKALGFPNFEQKWQNTNYTVGIDINVKEKSMRVVYFPFQEGDRQQYLNYIEAPLTYQKCK